MSTATKELGECRKLIKKLLTQHPHLRDSDKKLIATIWTKQAGGVKAMKTLNGYAFFKRYIQEGRLFFQSETISRARRLVQQENVSLRGKLYAKRHEKALAIQEALGYKRGR